MPTYQPNHYLSDGGAAGEPSPSSASSVFQALPPPLPPLPPLPTSTSNYIDDDDDAANINMLEPQLGTSDVNGNVSATALDITNGKSLAPPLTVHQPPLRTATNVVYGATTMANNQKHGAKGDAAVVSEDQNEGSPPTAANLQDKLPKKGSYMQYEGVPYICSSVTKDGHATIRCFRYLPGGVSPTSSNAKWSYYSTAKKQNPEEKAYRCPGVLLVNRDTNESTTLKAHECTLATAAVAAESVVVSEGTVSVANNDEAQAGECNVVVAAVVCENKDSSNSCGSGDDFDDDANININILEPPLATTDVNGIGSATVSAVSNGNSLAPQSVHQPRLRTATSVVDHAATMANTQKHGDKDDDAAVIGENQNSINVNARGSGGVVPKVTSIKPPKLNSTLKYEGLPYHCTWITKDGHFKIRCCQHLPGGVSVTSPNAKWTGIYAAKALNPQGKPYRCPGKLLLNRDNMESTTIVAHECILVAAAGGVSSDTAHADEEALPTADFDQSLSETADLDSSATTGGAHHMDLNGTGIADFGSNAHGDKDNEDIDNNVHGDKDGTFVASDKSTAVTESVFDVAQVAQAEELDGVIAAVASENQDSINVNACDSGRMVPEKTSNKFIKCGSYLKYDGVPYVCSSITDDGQFKIRCYRYLGSCKLSPDARWCSRRAAIASNPSGFPYLPYRCPGVLLVNRETMESTTISTHECMLASAAAVAGGVSSNTAQEEEPLQMADSIDQSHNEMTDLDSSATTDGAHQMDSDGTGIEDINNNDHGEDEDIDNNDHDDEDGTSVASDKSSYKDLCIRLTSALVNRQQQFKILKANHEKRDNQYKRLKVEHENQSQAFKRLKVEHENLKLRFREASHHRHTDHHTPASFSEKYA